MKFKKEFLFEEVNDLGGGVQNAEQLLLDRLGSPEGTFTDDVIVDDPVENRPDDNSSEFKPSQYWDLFKNDEGFTMPENVTSENENDLLKPFIAKKFGFESNQQNQIEAYHPYAKKINDIAKGNPNITAKDIVDAFSVDAVDYSSMPSDELIRLDLYEKYGKYNEETNPEGITDDDADEYLSKLDKIEKRKMSDSIRAERIQKQNDIKSTFDADITKARETAYNSYIQEVETSTKNLLASFKNTSDIYGIKVGQSDIESYVKDFKDFITPDKETGIRKLDEWLNNDESLFKLFVLSVKTGEKGIKELLTRTKENAKQEAFEKLGLTEDKRGVQGEQFNSEDPEAVRQRLSRPEGSFKTK